MVKCPNCGSLDVVESWSEDDFHGLEGNTQARCEECGAEYSLHITMKLKRKGAR